MMGNECDDLIAGCEHYTGNPASIIHITFSGVKVLFS
jgi:hypothetical protein